MSYSKLEPTFQNVEEIRMGSRYNVCDLELQGNWIPSLPTYDWQDKYAKSDNGRYLALVAWDVVDNHPGFRIIIIDIRKRSIRKTKRIIGCCESIKWGTSGFSYKIFTYLSEEDFVNLTELK